MSKSIRELIIEYFEKHPNQELEHGPVVDWVEKQYLKLYKKKPRDTWRGIRKLHQDGFLIKVKKGVYKYDPVYVQKRDLEDFTPEQKKIILERDGFKCVVCGRGRKDGVELHVDHIKPKEFDGKSKIENGQTLCAQHNFMKKTLKQTETGKKMFIRLYELSKEENNQELLEFSKQILEVYERNKINCHIEWKR
ncbi:MAG TPA: HNH endonuclease signature motif containing protein [bacterium]|nr:HNH endonuclease signature motif containing protein [bacterium]